MGVVLLVRHGQASFGAEDYDVLSDAGAAQGRRTGEALAADGLVPSLVVHGSMRRQRETAEAMGGAARWRVTPRTDPDWDEFDHLAVLDTVVGPDAAHGLDRRGFQELFEQATRSWVRAGEDPSYAESFPAFLDRTGRALRRAAGSVGSGETAVVVTSGGVIAAVCALLLLVPAEPEQVGTVWHRLNTVVVNTSVTRVVVGATGVRLLSFNEHAHLDRAQVTYR